MLKIRIESVNSGGQYEVTLFIPHPGTATTLRRDMGQDTLRILMDEEQHQQMLNAVTQWVQGEMAKHDEQEGGQ